MQNSVLLFFFLFFGLTAKSQVFERGFYVDNSGAKFDGEIKYDFRESHKPVSKELQYFTFKSSATKPVRLNADEVQYFVISGEKYLSKGGSSTVFVHEVFSGPVKVYAQYKMARTAGRFYNSNGLFINSSSSKVTADYTFGDNPDDAAEVNKGNFVEVMTKATTDVPQIGQLLKDGMYTLKNVDEMIAMYRTIKKRKV